MSKDITIQEGGIAKQLTANKLRTALVGGGDCLWVPEDEVQVGEKIIDENGTYLAADDGLYGYSQVTVRGVGQVTGKDGAGNDAMAYVDPDTGQIMIDELPSELRVITPPTNPYGVYTDGQLITKDGMVVGGYFETGGEWGTVPNNEITLDPTNADYSKTSGIRSSEYSEFGQGPWPQPVNSCIGRTTAGQESGGEYYPEYITVESPGYIAIRAINQTSYSVIWCSSSSGTGRIGTQIGTPWPQWNNVYLSNTYTHDGKTVYYGTRTLGYESAGGLNGMNSTVEGSDLDDAKAAWVVVYGTETQVANAQTINVSWPRPGDGRVLETTFEILVAPPYDDGTDTGTGGWEFDPFG